MTCPSIGVFGPVTEFAGLEKLLLSTITTSAGHLRAFDFLQSWIPMDMQRAAKFNRATGSMLSCAAGLTDA